jgi:enamine deaminase RidA (YjgF/YER057c/UK114 family)
MAARGTMVFVAGQIGWDPQGVFESDNFTDQVRQTLQNTLAVLAEAGAGPEHIVRMTWYITNRQEYLAQVKQVGAAYRAVIGKHFPVMTVVEVSGLMEDRAKVEIETTAVIPDSPNS